MTPEPTLPRAEAQTGLLDDTASAAHPPLHLLSMLVLLLGDWLAFGINVLTFMRAYWPVAGACALAVAASIASIERLRNHATRGRAALTGCVAGALILVVLPVTGTFAALALFSWWLACRVQTPNAPSSLSV
jgi:hypothetical protein